MGIFFAFMLLVCSAATASAFIVAKTATVRQDKTRQDKARKVNFFREFNTRDNSKCFA